MVEHTVRKPEILEVGHKRLTSSLRLTGLNAARVSMSTTVLARIIGNEHEIDDKYLMMVMDDLEIFMINLAEELRK